MDYNSIEANLQRPMGGVPRRLEPGSIIKEHFDLGGLSQSDAGQPDPGLKLAIESQPCGGVASKSDHDTSEVSNNQALLNPSAGSWLAGHLPAAEPLNLDLQSGSVIAQLLRIGERMKEESVGHHVRNWECAATVMQGAKLLHESPDELQQALDDGRVPSPKNKQKRTPAHRMPLAKKIRLLVPLVFPATDEPDRVARAIIAMEKQGIQPEGVVEFLSANGGLSGVGKASGPKTKRTSEKTTKKGSETPALKAIGRAKSNGKVTVPVELDESQLTAACGSTKRVRFHGFLEFRDGAWHPNDVKVDHPQ